MVRLSAKIMNCLICLLIVKHIAAIDNVYLNYRLFLLHGEAKYYDVFWNVLFIMV